MKEKKELRDDIQDQVVKLKILLYNYKDILQKEQGTAWDKDSNQLYISTKHETQADGWLKLLDMMGSDLNTLVLQSQWKEKNDTN